MRILLIEDDKRLNEAVVYWLRNHTFEVDTCLDGEEGLFYMEQGFYDCILLDRMLPLMDGLTILKKIREQNNNTPVIFITALGALSDKITGLDSGAHDYLVKPFDFEELAARIRCVTRRQLQADEDLSFGDLRYDPGTYLLIGPKQNLQLSKKEGMLIEVLLRGQGKTLTKEMLFLKVWGIDTNVEAANLENYIHFLRRRIKTIQSTVKIANAWGIGYRLEEGE